MRLLLQLASVAALVCSTSLAPAENATPPKAATLRVAPDFTRKGLDGKSVHLGSYRGKVVLLNFWATWCGPCITEIPKFASWQTKYGAQGFQVVGISMDDDAAPVLKALPKLRITYPVVMGDVHLSALYGGVLGLPVTYLIGTDGKVVARYQGEANLVEMEQKIVGLLPQKKAP
ncbi:MAG: TlpA family protein disulfide reductase [Acidobacteria bacterium]|nr:TlpA family protein disulfide reductase [Acidobacteriota bacterium]